jgi:serine/threonine protein kinase
MFFTAWPCLAVAPGWAGLDRSGWFPAGSGDGGSRSAWERLERREDRSSYLIGQGHRATRRSRSRRPPRTMRRRRHSQPSSCASGYGCGPVWGRGRWTRLRRPGSPVSATAIARPGGHREALNDRAITSQALASSRTTGCCWPRSPASTFSLPFRLPWWTRPCAPTTRSRSLRSPAVKTDLYALGCLGYELLAGAPPYTGDQAAVRAGHLTQAPPEAPCGDSVLKSLIGRLIAKRPEDRPQDARA